MQHESIDLEVFRAGDYGPKGVYTEADLEALARDYNPADHEAPVTLDHEQRGPAHGWVAGLRRLGDRLVATLTRLSPTLAEALRTHAFRKRSVELYRQIPRTGRPYLKAVTFLGAAAPEVKGLADPAFRDDAETVSFSQDLEPPVPDPLDQIRQRFMKKGLWKPEWNNSPLPDALRHLAGTPHLEAVIAAFESFAPPVSFGRLPSEASAFEESIVGDPTPDSLQRHRAALELLQRNPALSYRDALLSIRH